MTDERPSDVLREWFRRVWNERDERAIYELFPPEGEAHGLAPEPIIGPGAFHQLWLQFHRALGAIEVEVLEALDEGARASVRCRASARGDGDPVTFEGAVIAEVRRGQIRRAWNHWDFLTLMVGLGHLAPDAFAQVLAGKRSD